MSYCTDEDLLIGDLEVGANAGLQGFVQDGADEIDMRLGGRYVLPLSTSLPAHQSKLLKWINVRLATGRFFMAIGEAGENGTVNPYGVALLKEGQRVLDQLANGQMDLDSPRLAIASGASGPGIIQKDETSPVDAFYDLTMRGMDTFWMPGYK